MELQPKQTRNDRPALKRYVLVVDECTDGKRIDQALVGRIDELSRSQVLKRLVSVKLAGKPVKPSALVRSGDTLEIELSIPPLSDSLIAQEMDLDIIYQDQDVLVVNKPCGLVVHPAAGNRQGTLANGLLFQLNKEQQDDFDDETRPGIVHRLDKDTSGVMITAKKQKSLEFLSQQFADRTSRKYYLALGQGRTFFQTNQIIDVQGFLARDKQHRQKFCYDEKIGKAAHTVFVVLAQYKNKTLFLVKPRTGRTHQIRVHASKLGVPLCGDVLYGNKDNAKRLMLHAWQLVVKLPSDKQEHVFTAPVPQEFIDFAQSAGLSQLKAPEVDI